MKNSKREKKKNNIKNHMKNFEEGKKKIQNRKCCHDNLKSFGHFQLKTDFHLDKNQGDDYNSTIARV